MAPLLLACALLAAGGCGGEPKAAGPAAGNVRLRLWDYRWPTAPDGTDYAAWLRAQVRAFAAAHPGVSVQVHLLDVERGWEQVRRSLASGRVPDVLGTRPCDPVLLDARWQVPAERFLRADGRGRYLPPALALAAAAGWVWVWPRWLAADAWLARADTLRAAGLAPEEPVVRGWDWTTAASRLRGLGGRAPVLVVPGDGAGFFRPLLAWERPRAEVGLGGRLRRLLGLRTDGRPPWRVSAERLRAAADWARVLRASGVLVPPGRLGDQGPGGLASFLAGRAAVLAGANPWLAALLLHREAERGRAAATVLLPVPSPPGETGRAVAPPARAGTLRTDNLRLAGLALFRPPDAGDRRRLELAAELADFLSRRGHPWAGGPGPIFPAAREAWLLWAKRSGQSAVFSAFTLHRARGAAGGLDLAEWTERERAWGSLRPALNALWDGRWGPDRPR